MNEVESFREKQHGPHGPKLHDPLCTNINVNHQ